MYRSLFPRDMFAEMDRLQREMQQAFERQVHLFLFIKVRGSWADDPERYREMGLDFEE